MGYKMKKYNGKELTLYLPVSFLDKALSSYQKILMIIGGKKLDKS